MFRLLADAVQEHLHSAVDADTVGRSWTSGSPRPGCPARSRSTRRRQGRHLKDRAHRQFEDLLDLVNEGHQNMLMVGPAGTGKTTLAKNLAEALGLQFGFISPLGRRDRDPPVRPGAAPGRRHLAVPAEPFVEMYENGGVFLLDEMDAADANVMVAINAALANGVLANPNGRDARPPREVL